MLFLPDEVWINIINLLDLKSILNLALINKYFFNLTKYNTNWVVPNNIRNYNKFVTFINHFKNIKKIVDTSLYSKHYLDIYLREKKKVLEYVNVYASNINELNFIHKNKNIKTLGLLGSFFVKDEELKYLFCGLDKIKNLTINNFYLTDTVIPIINRYKLENLSIEFCSSIKNLEKINQKNLKRLRIFQNQQFNSKILSDFLKHQHFVQVLDLGWSSVSYNTVESITKYCKNLTKLNISFSKNFLSDGSVYLIAKNLTKLEHLSLQGLNISDLGIEYLAKYNNKIKYLNVSSTGIADMGLVYISQYFKCLERLECCFNSITRIGVYNLMLRCHKLKILNIINNDFTIQYLNKIFVKINHH